MFLLDLLEDLKFVDPRFVAHNFKKIESIITQNGFSITINLDIKAPGKIKENLKKVFLALLNFKEGERTIFPEIKSKVFNTSLKNIKSLRQQQQNIILMLTQIEAIKSLV